MIRQRVRELMDELADRNQIIEELEAENEELRQNLDETQNLEEKVSNLTNLIAIKDREITRINGELSRKNDYIEKVTQEKKKFLTELRKKRTENKGLIDVINILEEKNDTAQQMMTDQNIKIDSLLSDLEKVRNDADIYCSQASHSELIIKAKDAEIINLQNKITRLEKDKIHRSKLIRDRDNDISKLRESSARLENEVMAAHAATAASKSDAEKARKELSEVKAELERIKGKPKPVDENNYIGMITLASDQSSAHETPEASPTLPLKPITEEKMEDITIKEEAPLEVIAAGEETKAEEDADIDVLAKNKIPQVMPPKSVEVLRPMPIVLHRMTPKKEEPETKESIETVRISKRIVDEIRNTSKPPPESRRKHHRTKNADPFGPIKLDPGIPGIGEDPEPLTFTLGLSRKYRARTKPKRNMSASRRIPSPNLSKRETVRDMEIQQAIAAAAAGNIKEVQAAVARGGSAVLNGVDKDGATALHRACQAANPEIVRYLISAGAPVNAPDYAGNYPINYALRVGSLTVVRILRDTHMVKDTFISAWNKLEILISRLDVHIQNNKYNEIVNMLKKRPGLAKESISGIPMIVRAARKGSLNVLSAFCDAGADVNAATENGSTAIMVTEDLPIVRYLINHGASLRVVDKSGNTVLHSHANNMDILGEIAKSCIDLLNAKNVNGETPLIIAAKANNPNCASYLLNIGADPNIQDSNGYSPLHFAVKGKHIRMIKLLIPAGANIYLTSAEGSSPYDIAKLKNLNKLADYMKLRSKKK